MPSLVLSGGMLAVSIEHKHLYVVRVDKENHGLKQRIPLVDVDRVIIAGRPSVSLAVLEYFMYAGIPCYFVTSRNRWLGSIVPDRNMQAARRIVQYEKCRSEELALETAKEIVKTKILNSRRVLQKLSSTRNEAYEDCQTEVSAKLMQLGNRVHNAKGKEELRGLEGLAAAAYFSRLGTFFPERVPFTCRSRRPPKDPANALLSWTYTIVLGEIEAALRCHGLDPCIGFLHDISHGAPSLALDLLEPLRAPLCDLLVLNILNHNILNENDFEFHSGDGGFYLKEDSRKAFFQAYENAMNRIFSMKEEEQNMTFRKVIERQIYAVLNALEGKGQGKFFRMQ